VKAFLAEEGREEVLRSLADASASATSRLSYVECRAAFARLRRAAQLTAGDERAASRALEDRWPVLAIVDLDDGLARDAAALLREHPLRSSDAIHLASAVALATGSPRDTAFACFDAKLWNVASRLGFHMVPPAEHPLTRRE
jgi:predicted nucleic acid-binding protein